MARRAVAVHRSIRTSAVARAASALRDRRDRARPVARVHATRARRHRHRRLARRRIDGRVLPDGRLDAQQISRVKISRVRLDFPRAAPFCRRTSGKVESDPTYLKVESDPTYFLLIFRRGPIRVTAAAPPPGARAAPTAPAPRTTAADRATAAPRRA